MGIISIIRYLYDSDGDIGAMIRDPLKICHQILKHDSKLHRAFSFLKPLHMMPLCSFVEIVDDLLKRLHHAGSGNILVLQCLHCKRDILGKSRAVNPKFLLPLV